MIRAHAETGMTLLEIMVALMIFAVLGVMSYRGLDTLIRSREQVASVTQRWLQVERLLQMLEADLAQIRLRSVSGDRVASDPPFEVIKEGGADALRFLRGDQILGLIRVEYRWQAGQLELIEGPPDRQVATTVDIERLELPVSALTWQVQSADGQWRDDWPIRGESDTKALPMAIRMKFSLAGETGDITRVFALR